MYLFNLQKYAFIFHFTKLFVNFLLNFTKNSKFTPILGE